MTASEQHSAADGKHLRRLLPELLLALLLGAIGAWVSFSASGRLMALATEYGSNVWFDADSLRVLQNMTDRRSDHYRSRVHPLFSVITWPSNVVVRKLVGVTAEMAVRIQLAAMAALLPMLVFTALRLSGTGHADAALLSGLTIASASFLCFSGTPETHLFGGVSVALALIMAAIAERHRMPSWWHVAAGAISMSITVTNWLLGWLMGWLQLGLRHGVLANLRAFAMVTVLWALGTGTLYNMTFFLRWRAEMAYTSTGGEAGMGGKVLSTLFHTILLPQVAEVPYDLGSRGVGTYQSSPGSSGGVAVVGVLLWAGLLMLGSLGLWQRYRAGLRFAGIVGLFVLGQVAVFAVYGREVFLFSLNLLPALMVLASFAMQGRWRFPARMAVAALLVCAVVNNPRQAALAQTIAGQVYDANASLVPRQAVRVQMERRPADLWPRGTGHVLLAVPHSDLDSKAYHEPGGSFSPGVNSFGIAIWACDAEGRVQSSSDTIALDRLSQRFDWSGDRAIPAIRTETPHYTCRWSLDAPQRWILRFEAVKDCRITIAIRGVGPAAGPVHHLRWSEGVLEVNRRWRVRVIPALSAVYLGSEDTPGWREETPQGGEHHDDDGWGYARLVLGPGRDLPQVQIEDNLFPAGSWEAPKAESPSLQLDLPDPRFGASLRAQVAHLLMGTVHDQTRPGEPVNYPLNWLRDGAYVLAGLARAGALDSARQLSKPFAEEDFFGGFGPEADAPGLAIWALEEVASRVGDRHYDQQLWPHVCRKAELIQEMRRTKVPMHRPVAGPIVPSVLRKPELPLVCEPPAQGLIMGRMDWQRPVLFVNAVSYAGLLSAARLADRLDHSDQAEQWRKEASEIQTAWQRALRPPQTDNARTYIAALWPSEIARPVQEEFAGVLQARWSRSWDAKGNPVSRPLWTYFTVAEAHQWLRLGQPDKAWITLSWFWANQMSPGLYTWWEGNGEENSFGLWQQIRGWVKPTCVTPHYWTAAEMLLLQLEMLGYVDLTGGDRKSVV